MEYTSKEQSEKLKEIGVDPMTSDIYVTEDGDIHANFAHYTCPRCYGQLIWMSDFMRSEVEGEEDIDLDDDALLTYFQCKDCNCMVEVRDAWPDEAGDGALVRIAWTIDALIKLITDRDFDFLLSRSKFQEKGLWMIDVFYKKDGADGVFKKFGNDIVEVLYNAVVEIYEQKYK